ncbi:YdhK family protein [Cytobacillus sp. S13-E01]|uniref:YdhK family protein n=1 Tax=Cytobacillus sp. S13-E01 TaxID=3031326 RepID=UPI0023D7C866|nr:YdhK family protein [Cytobacillus sp. S13-E01]MDF0727668.1 YdhK family protein [Cytobacillus sp. S13-E01]
MNKQVLFLLFVALLLVIGGCSNANDENTEDSESTDSMDGMDHSNMDMSSPGDVPEDLKEAENPTYKVGSQAIMENDHIAGMKGAVATIRGAYDTTVYTISYTPTTGGERVENHKWVIHEEIKDAGNEPFEPGMEVTISADHMEGMGGVSAEIDSAEKMTVYMVDFTPTTGGEEVKNHKWVTESELSKPE